MKVANHWECKRTFLVFILTSAFMLFCQSTSQATVFWDDEMESGNSGYSPPSGAMSFDTSTKFSGNGSIRYNYPSSCYPDANAQQNCGGFIDRNFTPTLNLYRRFYIRLSIPFTASDVYTKLMRSDTTTVNSNWWGIGMWGSKKLFVTDQYVPTVNESVNYFSSFTFSEGQWYCVETHEQLNTPGTANGIQEAWVNGTQVMQVNGIRFRQSGDDGLYYNNRLYRQTGLGNIWLDRIAVGDSRIGCIGSASPPPAAPTGLIVQ